MNIFTLTPNAKPKTLIMLPESIANKNSYNFLLSKLISPYNLNVTDYAFAGLFVPEKGKLKKETFDIEIETLKDYVETYGIEVIGCGNADYYHFMTGDKKMSLNFGRILDGVKECEGLKIAPILNPVILNMFPARSKELNRGISAIKNYLSGDYTDPVQTLNLEMNKIIVDPDEAYEHLKAWIDEPELFVDIETTGLRWYEDDLLTMSFARNDKEAFCIAIHKKYHSVEVYKKMRNTLSSFFKQYKGSFVGHNFIGFDTPFLIHEIMRKKDFSQRHEPIANLFRIEDSMLLAYILYNSTEKPSIGLKELAFSFMGEYDSDVDQRDLYSADLYKVATYNNYDVIATCRIWKQLNTELLEEKNKNLASVYKEFKEIGITLMKMKMNGLRVDKEKVDEAFTELKELSKEKRELFNQHSTIKEAETYLARERFRKHNAKLKNKKLWSEHKDDYYEPFNVGSPQQKQVLFFDIMGLPVVKISKTSKNPSADKEVIEEWLQLDLSDDKKELLHLLRDIMDADKVSGTYLQVFMNSSVEVAPNHWKVFANFNQTGTISGRLSSSGGLNMQNLPSNSVYGSLVKKLLISDDNCIIGSVDYAALEDRLIAIEANDTNKLRVFTEGIDGHSLNASAYFKRQLEERGIFIDMASAKSINRVKEEAGDLRQSGKNVTFGMNYGASPKKIASQLGISIDDAQEIYDNYWKLYEPTKEFNILAVNEARTTGAVVSRFSGIRVKMASIDAKDDFLRSKEERRAANFKIQSGNFLTLRSLHQFQLEVERNGFINDIQVYNTVHDSIYIMIKNNPKIIKWVNENIIGIMCKDYKDNQALRLEAELDIGFNQKEVTTIKNNASEEDIINALAK
jgi:DNA polymerase-1